MISVRNEFETIEAFTHIAGCSLGTHSARVTAVELIKALQTVTQHDCAGFWIDLAKCSDDEEADICDIQSDVADAFNEQAPMAESCSLSLEDSEWRVTPHIDDDMPKFEETPEDDEGFDSNPDNDDHILVVNERGNTTLFAWCDYAIKYNQTNGWVEVWSIV